MKNIHVGQVAEYFDDKVEVTRVDAKTFDVNYADCIHNEPPIGFKSRPHAELVDMGNGRVIWNHE